jgi:tetratricopeptide (TPR) repeat protein
LVARQTTIHLVLAASGLLLAIGAAEFALRLIAGPAIVAKDAAVEVTAPADGGAGIMHREGLDGTGLGWVPRPGIVRQKSAPDGDPFTMRINTRGMRGPELEQRRPGHRRILFLGDSFTMAGQLPEEDTFVHRVGDLLRLDPGVDVEVVNAGVNGYSTYQEMVLYKRHRRALRPDTVVLCFFLGNDFRDNMVHTSEARRLRRELLPRGMRYFDRHRDRFLYGADGVRLTDPLSGRLLREPSWSWVGTLAQRSYLVRLLAARVALIHGRMSWDLDRLDADHRYYFYEIGLYQQKQDGLYQTATEITLDCIDELDAAVRADGGELLVALIPSQSQVVADYWRYTLDQLGLVESDLGPVDMRFPNRLLTEFLDKRSIPVIDMTDDFVNATDPNALFLANEGDRHFSAQGHRVAATAIAALVRDHSARLRDPAVDMRNRANALVAAGDVEAGEELLRNAIEVSPGWHAPYQDLAAIYSRQGALERSVELLAAADGLSPLDPGWSRNMARLQLAMGDTVQAIARYHRVLERDPSHSVRGELKHLYRVLRQPQKARLLDEEQARLQAREVNLRRSQVERTAGDPMAHFAHGNSLETAGDLSGARQAYETALALRPDFAEAGINLGALYVGEGRLDEAAAAFQDALEADPSRVEAMNNLGLIYREWGRLEEARDLYLKVLGQRPNLAQAHFNLALVYRGLGLKDEAIEHLTEAVRLDPGIKELYDFSAKPAGRD